MHVLHLLAAVLLLALASGCSSSTPPSDEAREPTGAYASGVDPQAPLVCFALRTESVTASLVAGTRLVDVDVTFGREDVVVGTVEQIRGATQVAFSATTSRATLRMALDETRSSADFYFLVSCDAGPTGLFVWLTVDESGVVAAHIQEGS